MQPPVLGNSGETIRVPEKYIFEVTNQDWEVILLLSQSWEVACISLKIIELAAYPSDNVSDKEEKDDVRARSRSDSSF